MPQILDQLTDPKGTLSLNGNPGPTFENEGQRNTSDIQGLSSNNQLQASQDLLTGRRYGRGRFIVFQPASQPPVSIPDAFVAQPYYPVLGGPYKTKGPATGRY
jgi:hypothetical protein